MHTGRHQWEVVCFDDVIAIMFNQFEPCAIRRDRFSDSIPWFHSFSLKVEFSSGYGV
jgi:hypothetical protein